MMESRWNYHFREEWFGPVYGQQILDAIRDGKLEPSVTVRGADSNTGLPAFTHPEFVEKIYSILNPPSKAELAVQRKEMSDGRARIEAAGGHLGLPPDPRRVAQYHHEHFPPLEVGVHPPKTEEEIFNEKYGLYTVILITLIIGGVTCAYAIYA